VRALDDVTQPIHYETSAQFAHVLFFGWLRNRDAAAAANVGCEGFLRHEDQLCPTAGTLTTLEVRDAVR
jgi:hypothetical protein